MNILYGGAAEAQQQAAGGPQQFTVTKATETDKALVLVPFLKAKETDAGRSLDVDKSISVVRALETDRAGILVAFLKAKETERAKQLIAFLRARETELAKILVQFRKAAETDTAQPLSIAGAGGFTVTKAQETDTARRLTLIFVRALETTLARVLVVLLRSRETSQARTLDVDKAKTAVRALETSSAQTLDKDKLKTLAPAVQTQTARPLIPLVRARTQDQAQPLDLLSGEPFVLFFDQHIPNAATFARVGPSASVYVTATPAGGGTPGTPDSDGYDAPTPEKVLA